MIGNYKNKDKMDNIKAMVQKKLNVLLGILFTKDKRKWYESLKISEETDESYEYYASLINNLDELLSLEIEEIQDEEMKAFCDKLLLIPELNSQITKLLLKNM